MAYVFAVILGVQRARAVTFPPELVLALDAADAYRLQLQAQRSALYRTLLQLAGPAIVVETLFQGCIDLDRFSTNWLRMINHYAVGWQAWLTLVGYMAVSLLCICGPLLCLLEWQLLLLIRVPPRPGMAWALALPLGLWLLPDLSMDVILPQLGNSSYYILPRDLWLLFLQPLGLLAGLVLAPRIWRWAAQSLAPRRWFALGAVCAVGVLAPQLIYASGSAGSRPGLYALLPLTAACRGVLVGNTLIGDTTGGLVSNYNRVVQSYPLPGLRLAPTLFIPLWLAPFYIIAYYAYSYWVLRRAGADPPPGYRGTWDDA